MNIILRLITVYKQHNNLWEDRRGRLLQICSSNSSKRFIRHRAHKLTGHSDSPRTQRVHHLSIAGRGMEKNDPALLTQLGNDERRIVPRQWAKPAYSHTACLCTFGQLRAPSAQRAEMAVSTCTDSTHRSSNCAVDTGRWVGSGCQWGSGSQHSAPPVQSSGTGNSHHAIIHPFTRPSGPLLYTVSTSGPLQVISDNVHHPNVVAARYLAYNQLNINYRGQQTFCAIVENVLWWPDNQPHDFPTQLRHAAKWYILNSIILISI